MGLSYLFFRKPGLSFVKMFHSEPCIGGYLIFYTLSA